MTVPTSEPGTERRTERPIQPRIEVVVVTWNSAAALPGLLHSLGDGLRGTSWHLTVADNASADESVALAERLVPGCRIVQTGRNAGYAAAFNAGLAEARDYDAALIVNPDIRLGPGSVATLFARLEPHTAGGPAVTGVAVPLIRGDDGHIARSLRRAPSIGRALGEAVLGGRAGRFAALGETVLDDAAYRREGPADWATGAVMLMSAQCLHTVGPWDESFFLYSEETDFALRARDHGFLTTFVPEAQVVHLGGESGTSPRLWSLLTVNRVRLYRKRHSAAAAAAYWSAVFAREAVRSVVLRTPRSRSAVKALLRPRTTLRLSTTSADHGVAATRRLR